MSSTEGTSWPEWFCGRPGNEFIVKVDGRYFEEFNLAGLSEKVPLYDRALKVIQNMDVDETYHVRSNFDFGFLSQINKAAETLYGLIHARFIMTEPGMKLMLSKFTAKRFGHCPRVLCQHQAVLPIGLADSYGVSGVKLYCPRCDDVYELKGQCKGADGSCFGTGFPQMFLMTYPEFRPQEPLASFNATLFGFRIHPSVYGV